jgi:uncharacterized protein YjbI with pentapeptide repeats
MADGNLSYGSFISSTFESVILDRVNFSNANLQWCLFKNVSMINCSFFETILKQADFIDVNLSGCKGLTKDQLSSLDTQ